jgi:hypothetical protein
MPPAILAAILAAILGLCRFGEAWAALRAENLLTYKILNALCKNLVWRNPLPSFS